ncbi:MAG: hypothetical protein ACYC1Q_07680 [Bacteroidia bacterium]
MTSIPRAKGKVITDDLVATQDFFRGYSVFGELKFKDDPERKEAGVRFPSKLTGVVPVDKPEFLALFEEMLLDEFILIVEDLNGRRKICGTIEKGMKFIYRTEEPGYVFEFYGEFRTAPPFYFGNLVVDSQVINGNYIPGVIYTVGGFWHFDAVAPVGSVGKDGDGYFDYVTNLVYEKQLGVWVEIGFLGPDQVKESIAINYTHLAITGHLT